MYVHRERWHGRWSFTGELLRVFVILCAFTASFNARALQRVTLAWDANTESNLAGYKFYYGGASGAYTNVSDVGNALTASVDLLEGGTYYFAVTAVNTLGAE